VPLVFEPRDVGAKAIRSSSLPDAPGTVNDPVVLMRIRPSGAKPTASISSLFVVNPTSEPSKYHEKVPAVFSPSEAGVKRTMSESSTLPRPSMVVELTKLKRIVPSDISRNAATSAPPETPSPTSEPSKYKDHAPVADSYLRMSSSLKVTPPAVPLVVELM